MAGTIKFAGALIALLFLIAGFYYGNHEFDFDRFRWVENYTFDKSAAFAFWTIGFIQSVLVMGFGHLIAVMEEIRDKR
jgi:hypothetical protein